MFVYSHCGEESCPACRMPHRTVKWNSSQSQTEIRKNDNICIKIVWQMYSLLAHIYGFRKLYFILSEGVLPGVAVLFLKLPDLVQRLDSLAWSFNFPLPWLSKHLISHWHYRLIQYAFTMIIETCNNTLTLSTMFKWTYRNKLYNKMIIIWRLQSMVLCKQIKQK